MRRRLLACIESFSRKGFYTGVAKITTNNYSCVPAALALSSNPSPEIITDLIDRAGKLAHQACDQFLAEAPKGTPRPLVAGGMPPLHESYRPDRVSDDDAELTDGYALIAKHIAPYSDVLLCETMRYNKCRPNARTLCALSLL